MDVRCKMWNHILQILQITRWLSRTCWIVPLHVPLVCDARWEKAMLGTHHQQCLKHGMKQKQLVDEATVTHGNSQTLHIYVYIYIYWLVYMSQFASGTLSSLPK